MKRFLPMNRFLIAATLIAFGMMAGWLMARSQSARVGVSAAAQTSAQVSERYILEHDADVAKTGAAPHSGPGRSTGYNFFEKATNFKQNFRKRVLHAGAAIGYHPQKEDEVYYILSGAGIMQMNGNEFPVKLGDAILTRPGSSHGLKQTGKDDLVLIISYERK